MAAIRPVPPAAAPVSRQAWVVLHRWAGLTLALFLVVAGATGALLPFYEELTLGARPSLSRAESPTPRAPTLSGVELARRVERATGATVGYLPLEMSREHVASLGVVAREGGPKLAYDTVWADPYTGAVRLAFRRDALADGPQAIMGFLFRVHYELALGVVGRYAMGVAALVWTLDCFVGFYLTLPMTRRRRGEAPAPGRGWWGRWAPAWAVRWRAGGHKLNFDLHRAGGLWLWPVLFVFAWSSVGFNLREVHEPVMRVLGARRFEPPRALAKPLATPPMSREEAVAVGTRLLQAQGARDGFRLLRPTMLGYDPRSGTYRLIARTTWDVVNEGGRTNLWLSAVDGRPVKFLPAVERGAADGAMRWMYMLHMAQVLGLPYRVFVSLVGLATVALSVTGVLIWMKKRSARLLKARKLLGASRADQPILLPAE